MSEHSTQLPKNTEPTVRELHDQAMALAEKIIVGRHNRLPADELRQLADRAYQLERQAAELLAVDYRHQPTRAILYRSAAWLALDAGLPQVALELADEGRNGSAPAWVVVELTDVVNEAWARLRGSAAARSHEDAPTQEGGE